MSATIMPKTVSPIECRNVTKVCHQDGIRLKLMYHCQSTAAETIDHPNRRTLKNGFALLTCSWGAAKMMISSRLVTGLPKN